MALAMNSGSLRELAAPAGARQPDSTAGPPPFSNSRLRSYANRVEGMLDPKLVLSSSVALTGAGLLDPFQAPTASTGGDAGPGLAPSTRGLVLSPVLLPHAPLQSIYALQQHPLHYQQGFPGSDPGASDGSPGQSLSGVFHARFAPAPSVLAAPPAGAGTGLGRVSPGGLSGTTPPQPAAAAAPSAPAAAWPPAPPAALMSGAASPAPGAAASAENLAAALSQIQTLKAEIAGVETVLGYLKGSETATTTTGRKAHKLPSQDQLRARSDALAASRAAARLHGASGVASSGGGAAADAVLLTPLRSSIGSYGGGGGGGGAASSTGGGIPSAARARSAGESGGGAGVYDSLVSETKIGRTWRVPRGPQPVGRGEAVILESALDEALPPGAITAKYGAGAKVELSFWSSGDVRRDFDMLEMVQREVSRQVSVSCTERGRIIEKLADRHAEIFVALAAAAKVAVEAQQSATEQLAAVRARAAEQASEIAALRSALASRGAESEDLRQHLAEATTAHEHYVWDNEQEVEQLQAQADILAAEVEHLHVRLAEAVAEKDAALSRGLEALEGELAEVTDERDDLAQRIRFLERQLHKLRTEMNACADTAVAEVQTDPIEWGPVEVEDVPDDCSDTPSLAEIRARYAAQGYGALTPEERLRLGLPPHPTTQGTKEHKGRKRRRALGHFEGLISTERPGRIRGLPWTVNAISAIYYDKLHADAVSDREGNPRQRLADFAVEWHMTRFGLRQLAELNLLDLIASVRQHYKASVRVRWFGQFTGLVEVGDQVDTTPHVSFYLAVLSALAAPNSLVSLFPDTGAGEDGGTPPVALKAAAMPEATKAIFKYLNEPEAAVPFLARAVDPLTDPTTQLVPLDPLVALCMAEYQRRWDRNAAHLRSLFRAADFDDDGYIGYDEFVGVVRQLLPDAGERLCSKMYSAAMRRLPEGQSLVDADTFLSVARAFGWDRWRIDAGPAATSGNAPSGAAASRTQSHWTIGGGAGGPQPPQSPGSSVLGGGGAVPRAASSMKLMNSLGLAGLASMGSLAAAGASRSSVFRKTDSVVGLSDADRAMLRVLDGALEGLDPPLGDQVGGLLEKLRTAVAAAQQQAAAAAAAAAALPGLELGPQARELANAIAVDNALLNKLEGQYAHFRTVYGERTDPAAAWLAFRMLLTSLAAATAGPRARPHSRSRPGSAKGTVGWGVSRTSTRLTIPSLPFRAGRTLSTASTITGGGGAASLAGLSSARQSPPGVPGLASPSANLGLGLWPGARDSGPALGPGSGLLSGYSAAAAAALGGGAGGSPRAGGGGSSRGSGSPSRQSRSSASRSPEVPPATRPVQLTQIIQGPGSHRSTSRSPSRSPSRSSSPSPGHSPAPIVATATPERPSLALPAATSPTLSTRSQPTPAATTPGRATATPPGAGTPSKRGVMFSLGAPPGTDPVAAALSSDPATTAPLAEAEAATSTAATAKAEAVAVLDSVVQTSELWSPTVGLVTDSASAQTGVVPSEPVAAAATEAQVEQDELPAVEADRRREEDAGLAVEASVDCAAQGSQDQGPAVEGALGS